MTNQNEPEVAPESYCRISDALDILYSWGVPRGGQTKKAKRNAVKNIREELRELSEAIDNDDVAEQLDAIADIIFVSLDYAYRNNLPIEEGMTMVNLSNSTKTLWGDHLNNCQDSIKALEAKGYEGLTTTLVTYTGGETSGSIMDKDLKVRKPLHFVEPMIRELLEGGSDEGK